MPKKLRTGRIFLDYLPPQATAVAHSRHARAPGAAVSMPLKWNQVKAGLELQRFTMSTAPALLEKSRAWQDYGRWERSRKPSISTPLANGAREVEAGKFSQGAVYT